MEDIEGGTIDLFIVSELLLWERFDIWIYECITKLYVS